MAQRIIVWAPGAKQDLSDILIFYVERNKNIYFSNKLLNEIEKIVSLIARHNYLGKITDDTDIRVVIHKYYQIFYSLNEKEIEILHVWDTRRNPEDLKQIL